MGSGKSKPSVHITDNSAQINHSIGLIKSQIDNLNKDLQTYQTQIDSHIDLVQKKFVCFDHNFKLIQNEFENSFGIVNQGIHMLTDGIGEMSRFQIGYEQFNSREHWEIFQNDWKENLERNIFQELQRLKNMKFELELDLHKKVGLYLLVKDRFNEQVKLYESKKNKYQMELLETKFNWFIQKTIQNNISNKIESEQSIIVVQKTIQPSFPQPVDLVELGQLSNSAKLEELSQLESLIQYPPELDAGIEELYMMTERFEEIAKVELKLKESVKQMITNFSNPSLKNPLDDLDISPIEFATKLYNSGIKAVSQIIFASQTILLVSNGYAYVPEYKYPDLRKKFISGSEQANLVLDWELENIEWVSQYLYSKIQTKSKSISRMIGYMSNQESIYQLEMNVKSDPKLVGKIGLGLWKGLKCNYPLDLSEETKPIILYNIFVSRDIESPDQITSQLIKSCGYGIPSEFAIRNLRKIIYLVDQNNLHGLKLFKTIFENFSDIFETQTQTQTQTQIQTQTNNLVNWIVSKYIEKKHSDNKFKFKFAILDKKSAEIFFSEVVIKLLEGYEKIIWNQYTDSEGIDIGINSDKLIDLIYCPEITQFESSIVNPVWKFNSIGDLKIFIGFVFTQVYEFYWQ